MPMNKANDCFISFRDAANTLGVIEADFLQWVNVDTPEIGADHMGRIAVRKSYVVQCSSKSDYLAKLENSFRSENIESSSEFVQVELYQKELSSLIKNYNDHIEGLVNLHKKYLDSAQSHGLESPVFAAYLLFSRAISILSCLCENVKIGYGYAGSMLRDIDETLDVALYFILSKDKDDGKTDLQKWFRLGKSPKHSKCRKVISEWNSQINASIDKNNHEKLMSTIYEMKSKFTHPTFPSIRDCSVMSYANGKISIESLCYGISSRQNRLLELAHFAESSIWTCYQQFMLIFINSMPLSSEDINKLLECDRKLSKSSCSR